MPDLTIFDLKRALVEVREMCIHGECYTCPFKVNTCHCKLLFLPVSWEIDDWKEDSDDTETA